MSKYRLPKLTICCLFAATATAFAGTSAEENFASGKDGELACRYARAYKMQVIHSSDNESSFQDPNTLEEKILGYSAIVNGLRRLASDECIPSIHVTAGDHTIPGPFYQAAAEITDLGKPGLADIAMFNAMNLQGNGMGNHEFDGGIDEFSQMLRASSYPFIAVNVDFSKVVLKEGTPKIRVGVAASDCAENMGKVVKSCWLALGETKVGLIGRAPASLFEVIKDPDNTTPGLDFVGGRDAKTNQPLVSAVGQVQEQIDLLAKKGVNRIILLDHAQDFTADPLQASKLNGVDIIAAAGSTGFFANMMANGPFNYLRPEDTVTQDDPHYPVLQHDAQGHPVLIVNAEQLNRYVGHLIVTFDENDIISSYDIKRSGPIATNKKAVALLRDKIGIKTLAADPKVAEIFKKLQKTRTIQDSFKVVGKTKQRLNGDRFNVRKRETNLGRLAADSSLWYVRDQLGQTVDVAFKNGGGIRDAIDGPNITRLTIKAALAFNNQLTILDLSGDQLLAVMENAVSHVPAADGRFPQIAGMALQYDASQPGIENEESVKTPSRVRNLVVTRANGDKVVLVTEGVAENLDQRFVIATNRFTAKGGDGFAAFAAAKALHATEIGEQQILEKYVVDALSGIVDLQDPPENPRVMRLDSDS